MLSIPHILKFLSKEAELSNEVSLWKEEELSSMSEFIDGYAIQIGEIRLVIIPSTCIDANEIQVPREWVDIPGWQADYYLGLEIDEDNSYIRAFGWTTHRRLKKQAALDAHFHSYFMNSEDIIDDIAVLLLSLEDQIQERAAIDKLPSLSPTFNIESIINKKVGVAMSRLLLPFDKWAAVWANDELRTELYELLKPVNIFALIKGNLESIGNKTWEILDGVINPLELSFEGGILSTRDPITQSIRSEKDKSSEIIKLSDLINQAPNDLSRIETAKNLGTLEQGNQKAIATLIQVFENTEDLDHQLQVINALGDIGIPNQESIINFFTQVINNDEIENQMVKRKTIYSLDKISPRHPIAIAALTQIMYDTEDEFIQIQTAEKLGTIDPGNQEAINTLLEIILDIFNRKSKKANLWKAITSLSKIAPEKAKELGLGIGIAKNIGLTIDNHPCKLEISFFTNELQKKVSILAKLYCKSKLPSGLQFFVLDESGCIYKGYTIDNPLENEHPQAKKVKNIIDREQLLQLSFKATKGDTFSFRITLNSQKIHESFIV